MDNDLPIPAAELADPREALRALTTLRCGPAPSDPPRVARALRRWAAGRTDLAGDVARALAHDLDGQDGDDLRLPLDAGVPLGPWWLERPLGGGGMGVVYEARHAIHPLRAAVKVLRLDEGTPGAEESLQAELDVVARLRHPAIAGLLDAGDVPSSTARLGGPAFRAGSPWIATELVSGGSLRPHCGRLGAASVRDLLLVVLDALAHAHARGILHLDVKPDNVLLSSPKVERAQARLVDFGLAFVKGRRQGSWTSSGTIAYMAPERYRGSWRDFGPPTDLFSVGCMAVHLISGAPPFMGSASNIRDRILAGGPLPRAEALPEGLQEWVGRCTAARPEDRFPTAAAASAALAALQVDDRVGGGAGAAGSGLTTWVMDRAMGEAVFPVDEAPPAPAGWSALPPLPPSAPRTEPTPPPATALRYGHPELVVSPFAGAQQALWDHAREVLATGRPAEATVTGARPADREALVGWAGERLGAAGWHWLRVESNLADAVWDWLDVKGLGGGALEERIARKLGRTPGSAVVSALARGLEESVALPLAAAWLEVHLGQRPILLSVGEGVDPDEAAEILHVARGLVGPLATLVAGEVGPGRQVVLEERDAEEVERRLALGAGLSLTAARRLTDRASGSLSEAVAMLAEAAGAQRLRTGPHGLEIVGDAVMAPQEPAEGVSEVLRLAAVAERDLDPDLWCRLGGSDDVAARNLRRVGRQLRLADPALARQLVGSASVDDHLRVARALEAAGATPDRVVERLVAAEAWDEVVERLAGACGWAHRQGRREVALGLSERWEEAARHAGLSDDDPRHDELLVQRAIISWFDARRLESAAVQLVSRGRLDEVRAFGHVTRAYTSLSLHRAEDAEAWAAYTSLRHSVTSPLLRTEVAWAESVICDLRRDLPGKGAAQLRCAEAAELMGQPVRARYVRALRLLDLSRFEEACDELLAGVAEAVRGGDRRREATMRSAASAFLRVVGDEEGARREAIEMIRLSDGGMSVAAEVNLAVLDWVTGRRDEARHGLAVVRGAATARSRGSEWLDRATLVARLVIEAGTATEGAFRELVAGLVGELSRGPLRQAQLAWYLEAAAITALRSGMTERGHATLDEAMRWYRELGRPDLAARAAARRL